MHETLSEHIVALKPHSSKLLLLTWTKACQERQTLNGSYLNFESKKLIELVLLRWCTRSENRIQKKQNLNYFETNCTHLEFRTKNWTWLQWDQYLVSGWWGRGMKRWFTALHSVQAVVQQNHEKLLKDCSVRWLFWRSNDDVTLHFFCFGTSLMFTVL